MKTIFSILTLALLTTALSAYASQPRSDEVVKAFLAEGRVASALNTLKADGWKVGEASATLAATAYNDEGPEGIYLVSIYYEKGSHPWGRQNGTLTGVAKFAMGRAPNDQGTARHPNGRP
jgi:hypothetical protein